MELSVSHAERHAAVVIPIVADAPYDVVFIERALHLRRHAGEFAFPGGAVDAEDEGDHARAAARELHEEIGVPPAALQILARLEPVRQSSTRFVITPFVGIVASGTPIVPDAAEAAAVHRVPLAELVAPDAVRLTTRRVRDRTIETWVFDAGPLHVWGLTGRILHGFVTRYRDDAALRAAIAANLRIA